MANRAYDTSTKTGALFGLLLAVVLDASAAEYPARPVRLVVPFGAGSVTDVLARSVSLRLSEALGQQIVVDNRAGAGGMIGADVVAKAAPDGYTLMFGTASILSVNQFLYSAMPYDSATAFAPITQVSSSVGTSGASAERCRPVTASARNLPALT